MSNMFSVLMILAIVAVFISLSLGLFTMAKGGEFAKKYSNKLMRVRIGLQATALLFFVLAISSR